jgi:hypothetical protein
MGQAEGNPRKRSLEKKVEPDWNPARRATEFSRRSIGRKLMNPIDENRVSFAFTGFGVLRLVNFTTGVMTGCTDNAADFPDLPFTVAQLKAGRDALVAAQSDMDQGGSKATAKRDAAWDALLAMLRKDATYVQLVASDDLVKLRSSGFSEVSTNRSSSPLDTPSITAIDNGATKELIIRAMAVANAVSYEIRYCVANGPWTDAGTFRQARRNVIDGLTPGTVYTFQIRAVGGSDGYSGWSDPVSHMSM